MEEKTRYGQIIHYAEPDEYSGKVWPYFVPTAESCAYLLRRLEGLARKQAHLYKAWQAADEKALSLQRKIGDAVGKRYQGRSIADGRDLKLVAPKSRDNLQAAIARRNWIECRSELLRRLRIRLLADFEAERVIVEKERELPSMWDYLM